MILEGVPGGDGSDGDWCFKEGAPLRGGGPQAQPAKSVYMKDLLWFQGKVGVDGDNTFG
ncbi:hypothetical protein VKT23_014757 [Stygiomarasmius scandens]|uniref:Uncharacterized protein n=1 Tax=Marasmiellus scandens TaxID=2682957 RepID=A0ABR1J2H2_9AGAR